MWHQRKPDPCAGYTQVDNRPFLLYVVNVHDDYKSHKVFKSSKTANKVRKSLQQQCNKNVYVTKVIGFNVENAMVCTNGYTYQLKEIDENEEKGIVAFTSNTDQETPK